MDEHSIKELIKGIRKGRISEARALEALKKLPFVDLGHTKVDHHRALRQGMSEVIYAEGKTSRDILAIIREMVATNSQILVTRVSKQQARAIKTSFKKAVYNEKARTVRVPGKKPKSAAKKSPNLSVAVISGGTADAPVVEEVRETLIWLGIEPNVITDIGVAGIHRLLACREAIEKSAVVVVVAGMEGALASVVGGLVDKPIIAVPVSVGYGAGAGGLAALLGMLNSCASGVCVTNIDNGFGAACAAARVIRAIGESR